MTVFLVLLGFALIGAGLISILVPLKALHIKTRGQGMLTFAGGFVLLAIGGSLYGSHGSVGGSGSSATSAAATVEQSGLKLLNMKSVAEEYGRYVVGTIKNNSGHTYGYAQVEINLYDSNDNHVGSTLANTNNLEAGGVWRFKAIITEENATKFRIMKISGF